VTGLPADEIQQTLKSIHDHKIMQPRIIDVEGKGFGNITSSTVGSVVSWFLVEQKGKDSWVLKNFSGEE
jgi:hypothetical protein